MQKLREREGMLVYKTDQNTVIKQAKDDANWEWLKRSWGFLRKLDGDYAPKPIKLDRDAQLIEMEWVEAIPIETTETKMNALRHSIHLLGTLQEKGLIHGDLTEPNLIWSKWGMPVAIDWDQSNFAFIEARNSKRPLPDLLHLFPAVVKATGDPSRILRRWLGIRPYIEEYLGWGTLLDIGCHYGDFPAIAAVEGMNGIGIDGEYIRPCIVQAQLWWEYLQCSFIKGDAADPGTMQKITDQYKPNIIMCFSTWPYLIQQRDREFGERWLSFILNHCEVFCFETQLAGDGPGPEYLQTKADVVDLLYRLGASQIDEAVTIEIPDRGAARTTWIVR